MKIPHGASDTEAAILNVLTAALKRYGRALDAAGVRSELFDLRRSESPDGGYASELCVYFWRGDQLIDAIEFHVFRGNSLAITPEELVPWLDNALAEVVSR